MKLIMKEKKKRFMQKELTHFDENLSQHYEQTDDEIFDRKERLSCLENGMPLQNNTILGAVVQEMKRQNDKKERKSTKKNRFRFLQQDRSD